MPKKIKSYEQLIAHLNQTNEFQTTSVILTTDWGKYRVIMCGGEPEAFPTHQPNDDWVEHCSLERLMNDLETSVDELCEEGCVWTGKTID